MINAFLVIYISIYIYIYIYLSIYLSIYIYTGTGPLKERLQKVRLHKQTKQKIGVNKSEPCPCDKQRAATQHLKYCFMAER